jgi:hypothetical protein
MNIQEILDALEFQTTCDFGHQNQYGYPANYPCQRDAEWSVQYHACPQSTNGTPGNGTALWCNHHYRIFLIGIDTMFDDHPGKTLGCGCGHRYRTPNDFIWNVTPLKAGQNHNGA